MCIGEGLGRISVDAEEEGLALLLERDVVAVSQAQAVHGADGLDATPRVPQAAGGEQRSVLRQTGYVQGGEANGELVARVREHCALQDSLCSGGRVRAGGHLYLRVAGPQVCQ